MILITGVLHNLFCKVGFVFRYRPRHTVGIGRLCHIRSCSKAEDAFVLGFAALHGLVPAFQVEHARAFAYHLTLTLVLYLLHYGVLACECLRSISGYAVVFQLVQVVCGLCQLTCLGVTLGCDEVHFGYAEHLWLYKRACIVAWVNAIKPCFKRVLLKPKTDALAPTVLIMFMTSK